MVMNLDAARKALKQYFGYESFRPMQAEIIGKVLEGRDTVVLMPTGGGKSICYQIPAIIQTGMCVVVSPLISLMKDQVESLKANGVSAAYINSSQTFSEQSEITQQVLLAEIKLLYVSPEKMVSEDFINILRNVKISLIAVDEAHCISSWGHDFRPEYTQLSFIKQQFPQIPVIALTATADKLTRKDIIQQLQLKKPRLFVASFDRPNLSLTVRPGQQRFQQILDFIRLRPNQPGIIYCLSRKSTEELAMKLQNAGIPAGFYHAKMTAKARARVQEDFINDVVPIICATIAFGMGIDKSNVRWVIHYNLPKNIEGYYQEIGRAGRDGLSSDTLLFYSYADVIQQRKFIEDSAQQEIKHAKLNRMEEFANAQICRRRILLNYFGERMDHDCGNCDICTDPPEWFDGTILVQKALSAIARLKEEVGMNMLIDVLRGSQRREIIQKGYDQIRTYGAGSDMSQLDWQQCLLQMLQMGLVEIAYDQGHALKLTSASREVLFEGRKVKLAQFVSYRKKVEPLEKPKTKQQQFEETLFEELRELRREIAVEEAIPPYIVFSDATLKEMAGKFPVTEEAMHEISGVGEVKFRKYGQMFIDQILKFIQRQSEKKEGLQPKGSTFLVTYEYLRNGLSVEEIAQRRNLHINTIYTHLGTLYREGHDIDIRQHISDQEIERVGEAIKKVGSTHLLKSLFDYLNGEIDYYKIRLAIALQEK